MFRLFSTKSFGFFYSKPADNHNDPSGQKTFGMLCSGHPEWETALLFSIHKWAHLLSVKWMPYFVADKFNFTMEFHRVFPAFSQVPGVFLPDTDSEAGFSFLLLRCCAFTGRKDYSSLFACLVVLRCFKVSSPNGSEVYFHFFYSMLHLEWLK